MTKQGALEELIKSMFNDAELRSFLGQMPDTAPLLAGLPGGSASLLQVMFETIQLLERHEIIDSEFFAALAAARPRRRQKIQEVAALWGPTLPAASETRAPKSSIPPNGCPPAWASHWGQDRRGIFAGFMVGGVEYRMRWIADGSFLMGSPPNEVGRFPDEGPQHTVTIKRPLWLGEAPVTQALWQAVMQENPSHFRGPELPVEQVSWEDCQRLCARLEGLIPGLGVRLPSEAEWEYACRAETTGPTYAGEGEAALDAIAWWSGNSEQQTHPVRQKQPNAWGLHDMLGNVWEWCSDDMRTYSSKPAVDPMGAVQGDRRVYRGGCCFNDARPVRAASRNASPPDYRSLVLGFRLARGQD